MAIFLWSREIKNKRIVVFCDNQAVVTMMNSTTSSCKNCMVLIGMITHRSLLWNFRVFAKLVKGSTNI